MGDSQLIEDLVWKFLLNIVFALGILPAAGGALLWKTFQIAKLPNFTYWQCWKAYLASCAYAYVAFMGLNIALGRENGLGILKTVIFCAVPFLVVPLILRNFSGRALVAEGIALLLIDLAIVLFILLSQLH